VSPTNDMAPACWLSVATLSGKHNALVWIERFAQSVGLAFF